jgi:hypothetical protein
MNIGFTGTRGKLTVKQMEGISDAIRGLPAMDHTFHHGDCIGADEYAAAVAHLYGLHVTAHPPSNQKYRAHAVWSDQILPEKPYLARNHDIVNASDALIACPDGPESLRSGTWATVRYAQKKRIPIVILMP